MYTVNRGRKEGLQTSQWREVKSYVHINRGRKREATNERNQK